MFTQRQTSHRNPLLVTRKSEKQTLPQWAPPCKNGSVLRKKKVPADTLCIVLWRTTASLIKPPPSPERTRRGSRNRKTIQRAAAAHSSDIQWALRSLQLFNFTLIEPSAEENCFIFSPPPPLVSRIYNQFNLSGNLQNALPQHSMGAAGMNYLQTRSRVNYVLANAAQQMLQPWHRLGDLILFNALRHRQHNL